MSASLITDSRASILEGDESYSPAACRGVVTPALSPDQWPDLFASTAFGTCLEPVFRDGACLAFQKSAPVAPGDFVGIVFKPEFVPPGRPQAIVKRLVFGLGGLSLPLETGWGRGLTPMLIVEQLNPPRQFSIPATRLLAVHKVIGEAVRLPGGRAHVDRSLVSGGLSNAA